MAISLPDARQLSDEVLQSLRLRALRGCELGYSEIEVAELLGLSRETVSRWWTAYAEDGVEALPGERTGRPVREGTREDPMRFVRVMSAQAVIWRRGRRGRRAALRPPDGSVPT